MALNLDKHKDSLVAAWRDVMNEKSATNWALFGYDGQTFALKVVSTGDGGIEEMIDDLSNGQIMYGLCRVKLQDKEIEKIALINWQGEGAPLAKKGTCANHVSTVKSFFKGVHVTINARTEEDVEPDGIVAQIAKSTSASGVRMSTSLESEVAPVGSLYKRVNPKEEINSKAKDEFWLNEQKEEERRKKEEQSKLHKFSRNEVQLLRRESQNYFNESDDQNSDVFSNSSNPVSPSPITATSSFGKVNGTSIKANGFDFDDSTNQASPIASPISSGKNSSLCFGSNNGDCNEERKSVSPAPVFSNSFVASEKAAALKASLPRKNIQNDNLVRQRIKSFDGSNGNENSISATNGGRNGTEGAASNGEVLSVLSRKKMFENGGPMSGVSIPRKSISEEIKELQQQESMKRNSIQNSESKSIVDKLPSPEPESNNQQRVISPVVRMKSPSPQPQSVPLPFQSKTATSSQPIKAYNLPFHIGGSVTGKLAQQVNKNSENNGTDVKNDKKQERVNSTTASIEPPAIFQDNNNRNGFGEKKLNTSAQIEKPPRSTTPVVAASIVSDKTNENSIPQNEQSTPTSIEITPAMGLCARALYDYQAADDTEITFDPGDIITKIEQIDQGWWEGMGPAGLYGLFPANYVELLN